MEINYEYIKEAFPFKIGYTEVKIFNKMVSIHTSFLSDQQFKVLYNFMQKYNYTIEIEVNVFHQMMIILKAEDFEL